MEHSQTPPSHCFFLQEKVVASVSTDSKQREVGYWGKQIFELSNHLGNVLATITDKKLQVSTNNSSTSYFEAEVQTVQDYYAFGMQMPGRKSSGGYRYGFNGKENDKDINEGAQDFGARIYDARLGRFFSTDPLEEEFEFISPYNFAGNNPIYFIDENGEFPKPSELLAKIGINLSPFQSGFLDGFVNSLSGWETIGFLSDLATDSKFRGQVWEGLQAMASDPMGTLKQMVSDKVDAYSAFYSGNATDDQEYEVGDDIGSLVSGLLTGAAAIKFFTNLEKSAAKKVAKETSEAVENTTQKAAIKSTTSLNVVEKIKQKGRKGNTATREQINGIVEKFEQKGWKHTAGGTKKEAYLKPLNKGSKKGGSYTDATFTKGDKTIHVNTVDKGKYPGGMSKREYTNKQRINKQLKRDGGSQRLITIPKS